MAVTSETREGFRDLLSTFRLGRVPVPITNRFPWQSRLAIKELLDYAASSHFEVRILTGTGRDEAYGGDIAKAMQVALENNCRVRVLVWNDFQHLYGAALNGLREKFPKNLSIRLSGTREGFERVPHFLTVGEEAHRLEMPHKPYDDVEFTDIWPETQAQICFYEPKLTPVLTHYFDVQWESHPETAGGQPGGSRK